MKLKELAESLNLSQTTVSRALNGYPEVREETRVRVVAAAKAANYVPNVRAQRLARGKAMTIGHVVTPVGETEMVNPIFADFLAGAGEVYGREGFDLRLVLVRADQEADAYRAMAAERSVDGLILQAPMQNDPRIPLAQEVGLPFLVHGRTGQSGGDYSWLDVANKRAFRRATDLLLDLGHRRIALVNGNEVYSFAVRRRAGVEQALTARGLSLAPQWSYQGAMTETYGYAVTTAMLSANPAPTAFIVSSIISAMGVRRAATDRGLRIGRDISIICYDDGLAYMTNDAATEPNGPTFTATRSCVRDAGRRCAELLIDLIRNPGSGPIQEMWEADLTIGQSTGPCPN